MNDKDNNTVADITIQVPESEYSSILQQAVAVIDKTRNVVTKSVCAAIGTAHWELGKLLHDRKRRALMAVEWLDAWLQT